MQSLWGRISQAAIRANAKPRVRACLAHPGNSWKASVEQEKQGEEGEDEVRDVTGARRRALEAT